MQSAANDSTARLGLASAGALCLVSAALALALAREHMRFLGSLCGDSVQPHCGWCFAAASFSLLGVGLLAASLRRPTRQVDLGHQGKTSATRL